MFNGRAIAPRTQVSQKQYSYLNSSANKSGDGGMYNTNSTTKTRNPQVTQTTSQGSLGKTYKTSAKPSGFGMSPKSIATMRDAQNSKTKFSMKSSPK